jgi:hypothetical protein
VWISHHPNTLIHPQPTDCLYKGRFRYVRASPDSTVQYIIKQAYWFWLVSPSRPNFGTVGRYITLDRSVCVHRSVTCIAETICCCHSLWQRWPFFSCQDSAIKQHCKYKRPASFSFLYWKWIKYCQNVIDKCVKILFDVQFCSCLVKEFGQLKIRTRKKSSPIDDYLKISMNIYE